MKNASAKILVLVPCFNEAGNLPRVAQDLFEGAGLSKDQVLVIDDGSTDETYSVASKYFSVLRLPLNLGIGGAVQTGILYALENNYEACIQFDGDGQHSAAYIESLLSGWRTQSSNIVIGSRFLEKKGFQSTFARRLAIRSIKNWLDVLFGKKITDPTSGFRLLDRRAMTLFSQYYPTDFPEPISIAIALKKGLKVEEVSVLMKDRAFGESSIKGLSKLSYVVRVLSYFTSIRFSWG